MQRGVQSWSLRVGANPDHTLTFRLRLAGLAGVCCIPLPKRSFAMPLNTQPDFPSRRVYVVKVHHDAKPDALAGRLENLVTRQQRAFVSGQELLELIATDLQAIGGQAPADPTSG
jgi:hypothetical protein